MKIRYNLTSKNLFEICLFIHTWTLNSLLTGKTPFQGMISKADTTVDTGESSEMRRHLGERNTQ